MKRITLQRHAKSSWKDRGLDDHDRPLNGRGRRVAPEIARRFARDPLGIPDRILTSSALRALTTARFLEEALGDAGHPASLEIRSDLYLASTEHCFELVRALAEPLQHVVLVGHNPGLCEFARALERGTGITRLPTGALVSFDFGCERWAELGSHEGQRVAYWVPKQLGLR